jgi:hypothetical protein
MTHTPTRTLPLLIAASLLVTAGCAKKDSVRFERYDESSASMARTLEKPALIYATADW